MRVWTGPNPPPEHEIQQGDVWVDTSGSQIGRITTLTVVPDDLAGPSEEEVAEAIESLKQTWRELEAQ